MATNITTISNRVQPHVIGAPKIVVDNAVIDAVIKFCEDTHIIEQGFEHDVVSGDITAADNDSVTVTLTTYIAATLRPVVMTEFRIDGIQYETEYIELLNDLDELSEVTDSNKRYFNYPTRTTLKIYGIDAIDQRFYIKQAYTYLTSITTIDDHIYDRWHRAIEAHAMWELMSMPNKEWSNGELALYNLDLYKAGVGRAKISKSRSKGEKRLNSMRLF